MVRRTVRWLGAFCALLAVGGAAAGWYYLDRADAMTRAAVAEALERLLPNAEVTVGSARFDWEETVVVRGLTLAPAAGQGDGDRPPIAVPELRVTLDRDRFREAERVEVRALTVVRPTLTLVRRADGTWNLADLLPVVPPAEGPSSPAWEIRDATVRLVFESPAADAGRGPLAATLHGLNVSLLPDSKRSYRVRGSGGMAAGGGGEGAGGPGGGVRFDGRIDLDRGRWELAGAVRGLELGGGLLADAALGSPELQAGLMAARRTFDDAQRRLAGEPEGVPGVDYTPVRVASADPAALALPDPPAGAGPVRLTDFGLDGDLSARFSLSAEAFDRMPEYDITVGCRAGTLMNRFLPFPLSGVRGTARIADGEVRLIEAVGRHGATVARAEGVFRPTPLGLGGRVTLSAERVPVTPADGPRLPEALRKLHELLVPSGTLDLAGATLVAAPAMVDGELRSHWTLRDLDLTVTDGTVRCAKFPLPVTDVRGTAKTDEDGVLRLDFRGLASGRPGAFGGWVKNPGRAFEFRGGGRVAGVPLDRAFRDALPPPARAAVEHMDIRGSADADLTLHRPPGLARKVDWTLRADVTDAAVRAASFPYSIDDLSGRVAFDSADEVWRFEDLRGRHGAGVLTGSASYALAPRPGALTLDVDAAGVGLDRDLRAALPSGPRHAWDALSPSGGTADARVALRWRPGGPVRVDLPTLRVRDGRVRPAGFPLALTGVNAVGSYQSSNTPGGGRLTLDRVLASHADRTPAGPVMLRTTAALEAEHDPAGAWTLSLDGVTCDGFVLGPAFRAALPERVRAGVEAVDLAGPVDLRVPSLVLRGLADDPDATTAAWKAFATLGGNTANLGVPTRLGAGGLSCEGKFDGRTALARGELRSVRADLLDHTLTDLVLPFRLHGDRLLVGSPDDPNGRRAAATAYAGLLRADVVADLSRGPSYRLTADVSGAQLGEYARQKMGGVRNLTGNLRGDITLTGRGGDSRTLVGEGNVEIKPAALGELNVVLRMFKAVNMNDPTMFHAAGARFDIANETVSLSRVDLLGEAISFVGRGRVGFDGGLDLEFYSKAPASWMPLVRVLSNGWVGVKVAGTTAQPRVDSFSPPVEGSLKAFLMPLSPLLSDPTPRRTAGGRF